MPPGLRTTEVLTANRYRNPGAARPGRRARGRRLGVRRPDRRRAGPGRPGGGARGGPAHPDAAPLPRAGRLLVAGGHRPAGPHHRRRARPGGGAPRAVAAAGRAQPPRPGDRDLDLGTLQARGVRLAGHVDEVTGHVARFRDDLAGTVQAADRTMHRFLDAVDRRVLETGLTDEVWAPDRPRPVPVPSSPTRLDLRAERIGTVLLATGFVPDHPWLRLPITEPDGVDPAAPRGHPCPGRVRRRPAVPAPPGLRVHRRRPARRPRRGRAPAGRAAPRRRRVTACSGGRCAS